jgi:ST7 protein
MKYWQIFEWWYFKKYGISFIEQVSLSHLSPLLGRADSSGDGGGESNDISNGVIPHSIAGQIVEVAHRYSFCQYCFHFVSCFFSSGVFRAIVKVSLFLPVLFAYSVHRLPCINRVLALVDLALGRVTCCFMSLFL